jgi:hypothetical protein
MAQAFSGASGSGSVVVYTVPRDQTLRLALLTFTLTTDATAGVHSALVTLYDAQLSAITARIWDWNEGGASMTLYYTYGIGLRPFNCTVTTGMMIPNNLPETDLAPQTRITVSAVNDAGATIAGDAISAVALYGDLYGVDAAAATPMPDLIPGLLPA